MTDINNEERRRSPRVKFRAHAMATGTLNTYTAEVLDLCDRGAMFAIPAAHNLEVGETLILSIYLDEDNRVKMQGRVVHLNDNNIGLHAITMDDRSRSILKRIVELGVANEGEASIEDILKDLGLETY